MGEPRIPTTLMPARRVPAVPRPPDHQSARDGGGDPQLVEALDQIADGLVFFDRQWRYTYLNRAAEQYLRLTADQVVGKTLGALFPGDPAEHDFGGPLRRAMENGEVTYVRAYHATLDLWLETRTYPTVDGIAVHMRDVSDLERQRRELDEATQRAVRMSSLLDISNEAFITEDLEYRVTYWNSGAEQIYGWTREEAVGRDIRELIYDDATRFEEPAATLAATGRWSGEMRQRSKEGRSIVVACRWQAIVDDEGRPTSYFAVNSDVTALREQQEQQSRARRLESLGTLAGGIAHDLNNVLTPVLMSVQLLRTMQPASEQVELLDGMQSAITRGANMINQVLSFARGVEGARDAVHVSSLIDELGSLTLAVLPKSIEVEIDQAAVPPLWGDATQILQVLVNLVTNARDAMPDGGTLRISVQVQEVTSSPEVTSVLEPGRYVAVTVEDSGLGMTPEVQSRIFEPFFTTKNPGDGTGLGLASSLAIARSHGGYLHVHSESGVGSRFTLYVPAADDTHTANPDAVNHDVEQMRGHGELVVVIDDEESIRTIVSQTLTRNGYRTVQAQNGRDAMAMLHEHADSVRLVFTDMMMPIMDGAATAAYVLENHPGVAIVASSGLSASAAVDRAREAGVRHFISKPFTAETLLRTIRDALLEESPPR
jgi:PAS domain S-box-containing protein